MKIFIAVRWGHEESPDGANGEDTNFVVRAGDRDEAAAIVDFYLQHSLHHGKVEPTCNVLVELGIDSGRGTEPMVLLGPWYSTFHIPQAHDYTESWIREDQTENEWRKVDELYPQDNTAR